MQELYTPTVDDVVFVRRVTKSSVTELGLVLLLKSFQRLGYFPNFDALPPRLIHHIAGAMGAQNPDESLQQYEAGGYRWRHLPLVRDHLGVHAFGDGGRQVLASAMIEAAQSPDFPWAAPVVSPLPARRLALAWCAGRWINVP